MTLRFDYPGECAECNKLMVLCDRCRYETRFMDALGQLTRYGDVSDTVLSLLECVTDINDDQKHERESKTAVARMQTLLREVRQS